MEGLVNYDTREFDITSLTNETERLITIDANKIKMYFKHDNTMISLGIFAKDSLSSNQRPPSGENIFFEMFSLQNLFFGSGKSEITSFHGKAEMFLQPKSSESEKTKKDDALLTQVHMPRRAPSYRRSSAGAKVYPSTIRR